MDLKEEFKGRNVKEDTPMIANPDNPTQGEIEKHELTHANYKGWCKFCKMGLARRDAHRRHTKEIRKRCRTTLLSKAKIRRLRTPFW